MSKSNLWKAQRSFYQEEGPAAWNSKVPFYITSNPYLANAYAQVIMRYIQDINSTGPSAEDEPFYILELGVGSGVFSFYLLKNLLELRNSPFGFNGKFVYIMSDLVNKNLLAAENHPAFKPFIEQGILQFALFNAEKDDSIQFRDGSFLHTGKPLIVVANYFFDSLSADAFHINKDGIKELQIKQDIRIPKSGTPNLAFTLNDLDADAHYKETSLPRFPEPGLNEVLQNYLEQQQETMILFPTGSFSCLERLRKISPEMMVLIADKGTIEPVHNEIYGFAVHTDCFSIMVDFHALGIYAKNTRGDSFQRQSDGVILSALFTGQNLSGLPETHRALAQSFGMFNPGYLYEVFNYFSDTKPRAKLETLLALMQLTSWDPMVFNQFFDVIMASLPFAKTYCIEQLAAGVHLIAENFFYFPHMQDTFVLIANFFQEIKRFNEALFYYKKSIDTFGIKENVYYNMGLCHYYLQDSEQALNYMRQTLEINAGHILAKGWIVQIQDEKTINTENTDSVQNAPVQII
ncbi:MAG TPA: SAM-dependent methyltransferase [Bacteroidia bacterium]|nr:SAM-dependent methyltransferase [Bacteroidia bacterium]